MICARSLAAALTAVVVAAAVVGETAHAAAPRGPAGHDPLPRLGHWRNDHPEDNTRPNGWLDRMRAAESVYGPFAGHWHSFHAPGNLPMSEQEIAAAEAGQPLHISWKPRPKGEDWAYTASGAYDDTLDQVMTDLRDHCGGDCWLSIDIEPDGTLDESPGSGYSATDFRRMWHRVAASRDRVGADNVKLLWVVGGFERLRPTYARLWPGNAVVDLVGHDPYVRKEEAPERLAEKMVSRTQWFVDHSTTEHDYASKPFVIPEYGCDIDTINSDVARGTGRHRADCIAGVQSVLAELAALGVIELEFYDARSNRLDDAPAADGQAYLELKQATETEEDDGDGEWPWPWPWPWADATSTAPTTAARRRQRRP